ncbi:MAG: hypothetical protein JO227_15065 [Acetobacteraceae bacterium]|nr:hypothetical protein [Acetobacteraceae bacterium]
MKRVIMLASMIAALSMASAYAQAPPGKDYGQQYPQGSGSVAKDYGAQYPQGSGSVAKDYGAQYPQGSGSAAKDGQTAKKKQQQ